MWVKICGISNMRAAVAAQEAGADAVGFVFAPSRRYVTPDRAQGLIMGLPPGGLAKVGVFVDEQPDTINAIARHAGLTHVQLHGNEPPEHLEAIELPVIKAFRIKGEEDLAKLPAYRKAVGILLDPYVEGQAGGTGQTLDWTLAARAAEVLKAAGVSVGGPDDHLEPGKVKLILAGGLTPRTVDEAIAQGHPGGVDVSSGVEIDGQKDLQLIYDFIDMAKGASL
jgi:phosphoribosylanthranilate isomerase